MPGFTCCMLDTALEALSFFSQILCEALQRLAGSWQIGQLLRQEAPHLSK